MYYILCRVDELIAHVCPNLKVSLPELVQIVKTFEEKVNASAKTEVSLLSLCVQYYDFHIAKYFIRIVGFSVQDLCEITFENNSNLPTKSVYTTV
jgi:hypothetical protein